MGIDQKDLGPITVKPLNQEGDFLRDAGALKKRFGPCFEIGKIDEQTSVPIVIDRITRKIKTVLTPDFSSFKDLYQEMHTGAQNARLEAIRKQLDSVGVTMNEKTYACLLYFTRTLEDKYHLNFTDEESLRREKARSDFYSEKNGQQKKLSHVFEKGIVQCAEIALLAQGFLQTEDVLSSFFAGDFLASEGQEFSDEHAFIVIREAGNTYIYDPTNPIEIQGKFYPKIYITTPRFDEIMAVDQPRFVPAKNIMSKDQVHYFGMANAAVIVPKEHLVET